MVNAPIVRVSVIMANFNGAAHIGEAVRAVLAQSEPSLELIVSDDGSRDDSLARAEAAAAGDGRLLIMRGGGRTGPAATRNRALAQARGCWAAIVDNDDVIEPARLRRLIDAAEADGADIAADNLLTFYQGGARAPHPHLRGALAEAAHWIDAATYARSNIMRAGGAQLGYLKPVFQRMGRFGAMLRYDEGLRIGEDADLVQRLLIAGARLRLYPDLGYRYRKHPHSISHRLDAAALDAMLAANERLDPGGDDALQAALRRQREALRDARVYEDIVTALKARRPAAALGAGLKRPAAMLLLREPLLARLGR